MLRPLMLHRVAGEIHSTDIVTVDQGGTTRRVAKLMEQLAEPSSFSNTISHSSIFGLGTGLGDRMLMLGGPRHQVISEEHCVARSRPASVGTASPVGIRIDNELSR